MFNKMFQKLKYQTCAIFLQHVYLCALDPPIHTLKHTTKDFWLQAINHRWRKNFKFAHLLIFCLSCSIFILFEMATYGQWNWIGVRNEERSRLQFICFLLLIQQFLVLKKSCAVVMWPHPLHFSDCGFVKICWVELWNLFHEWLSIH